MLLQLVASTIDCVLSTQVCLLYITLAVKFICNSKLGERNGGSIYMMAYYSVKLFWVYLS